MMHYGGEGEWEFPSIIQNLEVLATLFQIPFRVSNGGGSPAREIQVYSEVSKGQGEK